MDPGQERRSPAPRRGSIRHPSTVDRNLEYQQNFQGAAIAVIVMHAKSNDVAALQPLMPKVLEAIPGAARGKVTNIGS